MADETDIDNITTDNSLEDGLVTPVAPSKKGINKKEEEVLIQALGEDMAKRVMDEALVSVKKMDNANRFEVTVDRNKTPHTLFYYDEDDIIMDGLNEKTSKIGKILKNSASAVGKYSQDDMARAVKKYLDSRTVIDTGQERRKTHVFLSTQVRKLTKNLSDVFGFDDPRQLETFMAAWLMKDSTCRLSGIPGTGKTTVIESAAILMANSYGYSNTPRYVAGNNTINLYMAGQDYEVYLNSDTELRREWDDWRFSAWSAGSSKSGAYTFGFPFLQKGTGKKPLSPENFSRALFNCTVKEDVDADGKVLSIITKPLMVNKNTKTTAANITERQGKGGPLYSVDYSYIFSGSEEFETDAGRNEGYAFRDYLMENFYDARLDQERSGMKSIQSEMLKEIGIAKIDYDKRADEVLYGMEIQQITTDMDGKSVSAYAFEPIPRPVVTQPIKFFNEANRSQSGVEDAILGLIAEKTVEYRGKTFDSPSFVAWMDTNPHQKGNDLAFIDRIDTELFFTTITLGERYAQLNERYRAKDGQAPQQLLVGRITNDDNSDDAIKPYRFNELDNVWDFVGSMPFSPPAAEGVYDGLRDIAMLSVLFTQRYFIRENTTEVLGDDKLEHTLYSGRDIHQSPLMDISKASNDMLLKDPQEKFATRFGSKDDPGEPFQAPALFRRVLGFRFTNSLVKLSRAFAFLRGKDYVSRQEILDALPYVIGHRLGPARAGEDSEGRTNGLVSNKAFGTLLNEQEMIREFVVHGYLLADTPSLLGGVTPRVTGTNQTMMDAWDAFFSRCQESLKSSTNFVDFEANVLYPIKTELIGGAGTVIAGYTPVHWHLASMIVENERKGVTVSADYGVYGNYRKMYENYLRLMDRPTNPQIETPDALTQDYSIWDYYDLRGDIAREPHLFTDDRCRLLALVESRINTIAKGPYSNVAKPPQQASRIALATATQFPNTGSNFRIEPNPLTLTLRTYGDALGAYGYLISQGTNSIDPQSLNVKDAKFTLQVANWSDQTMVLTDYYPFNFNDVSANPTKADLQRSQMFQQLNALEDIFGPMTGQGMRFFGDDEKSYQNIGDLSVFITQVQQTIVNAMGGQTSAITSIQNGTLMACFELDHAPNSLGASELIKRGVLSQDNDILRLWLKLRPIGNFTSESTSAAFMFTIGITSNFLIGNTYENNKGVITETIGSLAAITDTTVLNQKNFGASGTSGSTTGWELKGLADAGNMTGQDLAYYQLQYRQVISGE